MVTPKQPHRLPSPALTNESETTCDTPSILREFSEDQHRIFADYPFELVPASKSYSAASEKRITQIRDAITQSMSRSRRGVPCMVSLVCTRPRRPRSYRTKDTTVAATEAPKDLIDHSRTPRATSDLKRLSSQRTKDERGFFNKDEAAPTERKRIRIDSPRLSQSGDRPGKTTTPHLNSRKVEVIENYLRSLPASQEEPFLLDAESPSFPNDLATSTPKPQHHQAWFQSKNTSPTKMEMSSSPYLPWTQTTPRLDTVERRPTRAGPSGTNHQPSVTTLGSPLFLISGKDGNVSSTQIPIDRNPRPPSSILPNIASTSPRTRRLKTSASLLDADGIAERPQRIVKPLGSAPELAGYGIRRPNEFPLPHRSPTATRPLFQQLSSLPLHTLSTAERQTGPISPSSSPVERQSQSEGRGLENERPRPALRQRRSSTSSGGDALFNSQMEMNKKFDDIAQFINFDVSSGEVA